MINNNNDSNNNINNSDIYIYIHIIEVMAYRRLINRFFGCTETSQMGTIFSAEINYFYGHFSIETLKIR